MTFSPHSSNKVKLILIVIHQRHFGCYYKIIAFKSKQMLIKRKLLGFQMVCMLKKHPLKMKDHRIRRAS